MQREQRTQSTSLSDGHDNPLLDHNSRQLYDDTPVKTL